MSTANRSSGVYLPPIEQSAAAPAAAGSGRGKYTLVATKTYLVELGAGNAPLQSVQIEWDAALVVTITIEDSNLDQKLSPVTSLTKGEWLQEDPSTAVISVKSTDATTGGATVTNATITVTGGTAGGAMVHIGNEGAMRTRLKLVVGATGGDCRIGAHGKASA